MKRWVYVTFGILAWLVPVATFGVQIAFPESGVVISEDLLAALGIQTVEVLTYPAGVIGTLAALPTISFGVATPIESLLISGPIALAAGYLQWFVVIPRHFGHTRRPPSAQKSADDASRLAL